MQAHVMGMISGNQCIVSHLKASEPFVAFLSHEVPLFTERITLNRQVGHEHGRTHTHTHAHILYTHTCISTGCRKDDPPAVMLQFCGVEHCTRTHTCAVENQYWMISLLFNGSYSLVDDLLCTW